MFEPKVSVGDLLTAATILIAAAGLLAELRRERLLNRRSLADKVRKSAGLIVAKVDRRRRLSQSFFDELQSIITNADIRLVAERDALSVRDFFWRELFLLQASIARRAVDEEIELAYADLYGFDPRIEELFSGLIGRLRKIDAVMFDALVIETQVDIISFCAKDGPFRSADLGNKLRSTCMKLANASWPLMDTVTAAFEAEMSRLVSASDKEIERRCFNLLPSDEVLPAIPDDLFEKVAPNRERVVNELAAPAVILDDGESPESGTAPDPGLGKNSRSIREWRQGESV